MSPLSPTILPPERLKKRPKTSFFWMFITGMGIILGCAALIVLIYPRWKLKMLEPQERQFIQEMDVLKIEAEQYREKIRNTETESRAREEEIRLYERQVGQYKQEMARLREQIKAVMADKEALKDDLKTKEAQIARSWERVMTVEDLLGKSLTPRVLKINREFNYIVINIGIDNQLHLGDKLTVERGGRRIATVEIDKLYDSFSSARIIQESNEYPMEEGDSVEPA